MALLKIESLEQFKLHVSRDAARHRTINSSLQSHLQQCNEAMKGCEHRLTYAQKRNQVFTEAFCQLTLMVRKYEAMGFVEDGRAVFDDVRWIIRRLVESDA